MPINKAVGSVLRLAQTVFFLGIGRQLISGSPQGGIKLISPLNLVIIQFTHPKWHSSSIYFQIGIFWYVNPDRLAYNNTLISLVIMAHNLIQCALNYEKCNFCFGKYATFWANWGNGPCIPGVGLELLYIMRLSFQNCSCHFTECFENLMHVVRFAGSCDQHRKPMTYACNGMPSFARFQASHRHANGPTCCKKIGNAMVETCDKLQPLFHPDRG